MRTRLLRQWAAIDALNATCGRGFRVLKGIEVDILEKGGLDLPDDVLAQADWVVASVHYGQRQSREQITARIVDALANPHVSAIAHPTGRLINRRDPYEVDVAAMLQAAQEYGKCLELNANPMRLDLDDVHCAAAKELGVPIVISTDAHSVGRPGCHALRHPAGAPRRSDQSRCAQHALLESVEKNPRPQPLVRLTWSGSATGKPFDVRVTGRLSSAPVRCGPAPRLTLRARVAVCW